MRDVQDHYFHLAKKEGYLSRAAYKLIDIDDRKKVLRKGDRVLDCGAAPGSWLQVAARRVGPTGVVVGIDLQPIKHRFDQPNVRVMQGDFTATPPRTLLELAGNPDRQFDVVVSDMAPNTTGDPFSDHHQSVRLCHALLDVCPALLRRSGGGGNLVMKVFEGEAYPDLLKRAGAMFTTAKGFKPKASRSESTEMYIVASGFRADTDTAQATAQASAQTTAQATSQATAAPPMTSQGLAKPRPAGGWSKRV